tara:strand:- start:22887 stop:23921 length:1035 start_codon:yes stop_codon:yes gene_type:complete
MLNAEAQVKYSDMPKIGDSYSMHVFDASAITVSGAGEGQTWDYSTMAKSDSFDLKVGDPKDQPEASSYTDADIAITNNYFGANGVSRHDLNIHYYKTSSSTLTKIGRVDKSQPTGGSIIFINTFGNEEIQMKFPIEYGSKNLDAWDGSFTSLGSPVTWSAGQNAYEVDATGTLKLPGKTINNVLRVKRTRKYTSTNSFTGTRVVEKKMYEWYVPGIPFPLLTIVENVVSAGNTKEGYVMAEKEYKNLDQTIGTRELAKQKSDVKVFPNPASDHITIAMDKEASVKKVAIVDLTGKTMLNVPDSETIGNEPVTLNTTQLKPGIYYLRVSNANNEISNYKIVISSN